jgi:hypothetical protein
MELGRDEFFWHAYLAYVVKPNFRSTGEKCHTLRSKSASVWIKIMLNLHYTP